MKHGFGRRPPIEVGMVPTPQQSKLWRHATAKPRLRLEGKCDRKKLWRTQVARSVLLPFVHEKGLNTLHARKLAPHHGREQLRLLSLWQRQQPPELKTAHRMDCFKDENLLGENGAPRFVSNGPLNTSQDVAHNFGIHAKVSKTTAERDSIPLTQRWRHTCYVRQDVCGDSSNRFLMRRHWFPNFACHRPTPVLRQSDYRDRCGRDCLEHTPMKHCYIPKIVESVLGPAILQRNIHCWLKVLAQVGGRDQLGTKEVNPEHLSYRRSSKPCAALNRKRSTCCASIRGANLSAVSSIARDMPKIAMLGVQR